MSEGAYTCVPRKELIAEIERLRALLRQTDDSIWAEKREYYRETQLGKAVEAALSHQQLRTEPK